MPGTGSTGAIDASLQPSLRALQWAFWLHVIPACLLPFATTEKFYALPILGLIALSWLCTRRHSALGFGPQAVGRILARTDGSWWIETANEGGQAAQLQADSFVSGWLLVLRFRTERGRRYSRLLVGGEADEAVLRKLRMRLLTRSEIAADRASADH